MAKLVDIWRCDQPVDLLRRQMPLIVDDNLTMIMDLNNLGYINENPLARGKPLDEFIKKLNVLTKDEVKASFKATNKDILSILGQAVPCVGCRRSVERLFYDLMGSEHQALDPLIVTPEGMVTIEEETLAQPKLLCTILQGHSARLNSLLERQTRNKKSRRCALHSLEVQRMRPPLNAWKEAWDVMKTSCRQEVTLVETDTLESALDIYLRKHRFCGECRTKVLLASTLLTSESEPMKEKGYVPALYAGIKRCIPERHVHLPTNTDYISSLIDRAQPEIIGRERHAKTLEIAQEEVLTCLGICVTDRLYRIHRRLREEETICQVFAAVAIETLFRNFQIAVETKQGITQLELLYEEFTREEIIKKQRREKLRLKRKKKKERKYENIEEKENNCEGSEEKKNISDDSRYVKPKPTTNSDDRHTLQIVDPIKKEQSTCGCPDCSQKPKINETSPIVKISLQLPQSPLSRNKKLVRKPSQPSLKTANIKEVLNKPKIILEKASSPKKSKIVKEINRELCLCCEKFCDHSVKIKKDSEWYLEKIDKSSEVGVINQIDLNRDLNQPLFQDYGYLSEHNASSSSVPSTPEGSEVACSEGYCSHEGECPDNRFFEKPDHSMLGITLLREHGLTLTQMLEDSRLSENENTEYYISAEEVRNFKAQMCQLREKRLQLRQNLRERFAILCSHYKSCSIPQ
ncbi:gametogenetin-binding protein 2-like [Chelonus insularis]|uniref:gametogenetin-binding protein 2-like n=1 Tax=Chelonus insularis TaxID=460826 RepID=UPI00158B27BF|nr:gametogenetin-binding protein 2-like [Chelonus insularis]